MGGVVGLFIETQSEDRYLIEREGLPLGVIVAEPHGYVVYACSKHIWPLDHKVFESLDDAERQIAQCAQDAKSAV